MDVSAAKNRELLVYFSINLAHFEFERQRTVCWRLSHRFVLMFANFPSSRHFRLPRSYDKSGMYTARLVHYFSISYSVA